MRFRHSHSDLAQTLSFALVHVVLAISIGWMLSGSFVFGALLALIEPVCNTFVSHGIGKLFKNRGNGQRAALLKSGLVGVSHLLVAVTLAKLLTGSFVSAWAYALIEPAANTVAHYLFERWWKRGARGPAAQAGTQRGLHANRGALRKLFAASASRTRAIASQRRTAPA